MVDYLWKHDQDQVPPLSSWLHVGSKTVVGHNNNNYVLALMNSNKQIKNAIGVRMQQLKLLFLLHVENFLHKNWVRLFISFSEGIIASQNSTPI